MEDVDESLLLFVLNDSQSYGERLAEKLGVSLAEHIERQFEDGEHKARPLQNVRNRDVFVLQSLYSDNKRSVNDKLCRLLFFLGAVRDAGAKRVTAVVPYLCYARKDRKTKTRDPITTRYIGQLFHSMGTDRIISMDVHNLAAFQNANRIPTVHLEGRLLFSERLLQVAGNRELTVVTPDTGGAKRARKLQQTLQAQLDQSVPMAFMEKNRSMGEVSGDLFTGSVRDRVAVIIDDLISSGTTMVRCARRCHNEGAERVYALATHGLFAKDANETLQDESLDEIFITDTVEPFRLSEGPVKSKTTVLETSELFATAIRAVVGGEDLEEHFALPDDVAYGDTSG